MSFAALYNMPLPNVSNNNISKIVERLEVLSWSAKSFKIFWRFDISLILFWLQNFKFIAYTFFKHLSGNET